MQFVLHGDITLQLYKWYIDIFTSSQRNWVLARIAMDAATANRLSAIATETEQLKNEIEGHRRVLNNQLRSVRTMDPAKKEARIRATRERIEGLEERQEALRVEQQVLFIRLASR